MSARPLDDAVRRRLQFTLDCTFFVEAGAGTGKTHQLVARIVELVAAGRVAAPRLAAITFTDAAAAELRDRVRQGLTDGATDPGRTDEARDRCRVALGEIDQAAIQTIHAFAAGLLRAYPLEAGLPPGFATLDVLQEQQHFEERFRAWVYDDLPNPERPVEVREAVRRALLLGLTLDDLRTIAREFQDQADLLDHETRWDRGAPRDPVGPANAIGAALLGLEEYVPYARQGEADELVQQVRRTHFTASRLNEARDADGALIALRRLAEQPPLEKSSQGQWRNHPAGNPCTIIKGVFKAARSDAARLLGEQRAAALADVLHLLRDFVLGLERERKHQGVATFQDLLKWARDLLRDNAEVRRSAADWFQQVFVDEFQDTDPLQAEIVWLLAGDPAQAAEPDWRHIHLTPGKLFLVGDPKQSIYRFRRADIATYQHVFSQIDAPDGAVSLTQSFRSVAGIMDWVNHHFHRAMTDEPGTQPEYQALAPRPLPAEPLPPPRYAAVYRTGGLLKKKECPAPQRRKLEAEQVARIVSALVGHGEVPAGPRGGPPTRPLRYQDICVLLPKRTSLRQLERALEAAAIPYRMESGSLVLQTQEVRDLLSCLRAIDDPSDQVALVAALRSPAYGCSDVDLLEWVEAGGKLDYEEPIEHGAGPVAVAFESLRRFHQARQERSAAATIEAFLHERMLALQCFGRARPRESWRRLRFVVDRARALAGSGRPTLRAVVDYLEDRRVVSDHSRESPVPEADEDAVRIMTIHGAKGLEFPVVILTGLGDANSESHRVHVITDHLAGRIAVRCGGLKRDDFESGFRTADYREARAREELATKAESVRLLYVASTRAREHLFLCLHHSDQDSHAAAILHHLDGAPPDLCREFEVAHDVLAAAGSVTAPPALAEVELDEAAWIAQRQDLLGRLTVERRITPSSLARRLTDEAARPALAPEPAEDDPAPGPPVDSPVETAIRLGRGATERGRAVHAVLQFGDLQAPEDFERIAARVLPDYRTDATASEIARYARAAAASDAVKRALAARRYWRELPVGVELDGTIVEGTIDLLYEHADGTLGVVDYKTDHIDEAEANARAEHHAIQGGAYALAVEHATGRRVASFEVVFAALDGRTVRVEGGPLRTIVERAQGLIAV